MTQVLEMVTYGDRLRVTISRAARTLSFPTRLWAQAVGPVADGELSYWEDNGII